MFYDQKCMKNIHSVPNYHTNLQYNTYEQIGTFRFSHLKLTITAIMTLKYSLFYAFISSDNKLFQQ